MSASKSLFEKARSTSWASIHRKPDRRESRSPLGFESIRGLGRRKSSSSRDGASASPASRSTSKTRRGFSIFSLRRPDKYGPNPATTAVEGASGRRSPLLDSEQAIHVPVLLQTFDAQVDEEGLSKFYIWYLYYDIVDHPVSAYHWYDRLPNLELRGWIEVGRFLDHNGLSALPGLQRTCDDIGINQEDLRQRLIKVSKRGQMRKTEMLQVVRLAKEEGIGELRATCCIRDKLTRDRRDVRKLLPHVTVPWDAMASEIIVRIHDYLNFVVHPLISRQGGPRWEFRRAATEAHKKKTAYRYFAMRCERFVPGEPYKPREGLLTGSNNDQSCTTDPSATLTGHHSDDDRYGDTHSEKSTATFHTAVSDALNNLGEGLSRATSIASLDDLSHQVIILNSEKEVLEGKVALMELERTRLREVCEQDPALAAQLRSMGIDVGTPGSRSGRGSRAASSTHTASRRPHSRASLGQRYYAPGGEYEQAIRIQRQLLELDVFAGTDRQDLSSNHESNGEAETDRPVSERQTGRQPTAVGKRPGQPGRLSRDAYTQTNLPMASLRSQSAPVLPTQVSRAPAPQVPTVPKLSIPRKLQKLQPTFNSGKKEPGPWTQKVQTLLQEAREERKREQGETSNAQVRAQATPFVERDPKDNLQSTDKQKRKSWLHIFRKE